MREHVLVNNNKLNIKKAVVLYRRKQHYAGIISTWKMQYRSHEISLLTNEIE